VLGRTLGSESVRSIVVDVGLANGHLDTWRHIIYSWERPDPTIHGLDHGPELGPDAPMGIIVA
jgi:hypothetical protein